ncbi:hypothetical protein A3K73_04095 [Candidatus Pacearchaeota archaeon RBG_13_36_9]|nr:MAG: hypothetical protein A3K73_04095 [Candidatus Pacearchaeota archaeon RBG_13_36_9]
MKKVSWKSLIASFVAVYLVAALGSIFTVGNTSGEWYESIKPSITPPGWVFPIVWNILFFLIALSLYFSWNAADGKSKKKIALVFGVNFLLNILWSYFYFFLKNPAFAFADIIFLEASIVAMILVTYKTSKKAAYLLAPYLLWVGFAAVLNYLSL